MIMKYFHNWFKDTRFIFREELRRIFSDSGVMLIFLAAGLGYPLLYNCIYHNGILEDTPIAVVDLSNSEQSRRYIREVDATRELKVACKCTDMSQAQKYMQERKVNGAIYFPEDFGKNIVEGKTATLSIYADMSSFLYYKNLMMGTNFVMLDQMKQIKIERYASTGMTGKQVSQLIEAIPYDENNPYNRTFSYTIFFLSAALLLIIQQVMFYGMILRTGTSREEGKSYFTHLAKRDSTGLGRIIIGRGGAYWLLFMIVGIYIACIVPAIFNFPQRGNFWDIIVLLLFYVTSCVFFATFWSSFFKKRETVLVTLLFLSPIAMFLTGFSWPVTSFPTVWRLFSYIFPTSFACPAFINLNTAGCDLSQVSDLIRNLAIQGCIYCFLCFIAGWIESRLHYGLADDIQTVPTSA